MKSLTSKIIAAALTFTSMSVCTAKAQSGPKLNGFCPFLVSSSQQLYRTGPAQSGRFKNLGAGYYRKTILGCEKVTNFNFMKSGTMSLELWAMPYYGATSGSVVMSLGASALQPWQSRIVSTFDGQGKSLNTTSFGSVQLFEYTLAGWKFRDEQRKTFPSAF